MLHAPTSPPLHHPHELLYKSIQDSPTRYTKNILDNEPAEVVDIALQVLQRAGVRLMEWRALLHRRMNVPRMAGDFSYVVTDDDLQGASEVLSTIGLPPSPADELLLKCDGDLQAQGRFHRITKHTSRCFVQHIVLYPLSFTTLSPSELLEEAPLHKQPSLCRTTYIPRRSAVYASLLRMMLRYPRYCPTRSVLQTDLSDLVMYDLLGYRLEDDSDDGEDEESEEDLQGRVENAQNVIRKWGRDKEWREGEEWFGDAIAAIAAGGSVRVDYLPHSCG